MGSSTHLVVATSGSRDPQLVNDHGGKLFLFKKDGSGNYPTTATTNITAYTGQGGFGGHLALSSTHGVVGIDGPDGGEKVFIFKKDSSGDYPTTATTILTNVRQGRLALSETHLVVKAPYVDPYATHDHSQGPYTGPMPNKALLIFKKDSFGDYPTTATANVTGSSEFRSDFALSSTHLMVHERSDPERIHVFKVA